MPSTSQMATIFRAIPRHNGLHYNGRQNEKGTWLLPPHLSKLARYLSGNCARPTRGARDRALREHRRSSGSILPLFREQEDDRLPAPLSAELIPSITLFDRPEHRFFEFLQRHVLRIAHGLQFLVEIVEWLDRSFI